jgi:formylglycine-generating enzyme required for sulfatase activity
MSGNVYEWCSDRYGSYSSDAEDNPQGAESDYYRVNRGGSWDYDAKDCRVARRGRQYPDDISIIGIRVVLPGE